MLLRLLAAAAGLIIVIGTIGAAVKTFVLPRGVNVRLTSLIFRAVGWIFWLRARKARSYAERDRMMALFAPLTLVLMPAVFLALVLVGYMALFWALDMAPLATVFKLSGSSLLTLGYESGGTIPHKILEFSEAMIGLILVALLIAFLPTIYSAFSRRETAVAMLEAYAGSPPAAQEMLLRANRIGELRALRDVWTTWQIWFAEVEESHTSLASLAFFRSPQGDRSWVTAAGTILDAAALLLSTVDLPREPHAAICIRNGYIALRRVADYFEMAYDPAPGADDPISISQQEFDAAYDALLAGGVPVKPDRAQAWRDFAGWRVNYDAVLLQLAALTMAPYAPWVSDRSAVYLGKQTAG
ncbi:MAG: hypothetical protein KC425_14200 [Anaerolineales bacterium]|nr:hypothetical protein [Anaerolineales bacterium]